MPLMWKTVGERVPCPHCGEQLIFAITGWNTMYDSWSGGTDVDPIYSDAPIERDCDCTLSPQDIANLEFDGSYVEQWDEQGETYIAENIIKQLQPREYHPSEYYRIVNAAYENYHTNEGIFAPKFDKWRIHDTISRQGWVHFYTIYYDDFVFSDRVIVVYPGRTHPIEDTR